MVFTKEDMHFKEKFNNYVQKQINKQDTSSSKGHWTKQHRYNMLFGVTIFNVLNKTSAVKYLSWSIIAFMINCLKGTTILIHAFSDHSIIFKHFIHWYAKVVFWLYLSYRDYDYENDVAYSIVSAVILSLYINILWSIEAELCNKDHQNSCVKSNNDT